MKQTSNEWLEKVIYYTIIFLILREWLQPIMQLTKTGYFSLFSVFIALCLVIKLAKLHLVISWLLKISFIAWFITYVYSDVSALSAAGLHFLTDEIRYNMATLLSGGWANVTDAFRSSLFFILIWMLVYLIHHWVTVRMSIFYFFVLTVFFIATLDTFSDYDGSAAIVKVVLLGLVMTAMLFMKRMMKNTETVLQWNTYFKYIAPVVLSIVVVGIIAVLLPKAQPQWPDPVPYIKSVAGQGEGTGTNGTISKAGYGDNDRQLGGPFIEDDTVVFHATAENKQYWRVETKDLYTSHGWENSDGTQIENYIQRDEIPLSMLVDEDGVKMESEIISFADYQIVLQPYRTTSVSFDDSNVDLQINLKTERLVAVSEDEAVANYHVAYTQPSYSYTQLKAATNIAIPENRFLQLPENLPQRVTDLAQEITGERESVYEKARAIESYFRRNGFRYETKNVAVPSETQDYVDQFLFETKMGYCDNFSTSMVVMLRSVGISARWVKGFASGTEIERTDDGVRTYEITNNDAHSWVEAYIDGIGWMPFEPTIGFTSPAQIDYDLETASDEEDELLQEEQKQQLEQKQKEELEQTAANKTSIISTDKSFLKWLLPLIAAIILVASVILVKRRRKWLPKVYVQMNRKKPQTADTFEDSYILLLKQLEAFGLKRQKGQTLQEYATVVDRYFETDKMSLLTNAYERSIYADTTENIDFEEMKEIWEYLINRTTG